MAKAANDVPPIPVPPVEPTPAAAVIPPLVDLTAGAAEAPRPDPYAPAAVNPYYQQQAPQQPYAYQPYQAGPPTGLSITSMILGIAGIFFGLLVSVGAVITGHLAQKSQPHARGFWITGLITGYIGIGLWVLVIGLYILFFVLAFAASSTYSYY